MPTRRPRQGSAGTVVGNQPPPARVVNRWRMSADEETVMGKGILLWLIGIPLPVILILWLIFR